MNTIRSHLSFSLLPPPDRKEWVKKDILLLLFCLFLFIIPGSAQFLYPLENGWIYIVAYLFLFMIAYLILKRTKLRDQPPLKGEIHFASDGIAVLQGNEEHFFPYCQILYLHVHYVGFSILSFDSLFTRHVFNRLDIIHNYHPLTYYFHSEDADDEKKLFVVLRTIIPKEVNCLYKVKNEISIKRENGLLIGNKKNVFRSIVSHFKNMDGFSYFQHAVFTLFLGGLFIYFTSKYGLMMSFVLCTGAVVFCLFLFSDIKHL